MVEKRTPPDVFEPDDKPGVDEEAGVMVYGNLKIIDVDTGKVLVNKRA